MGAPVVAATLEPRAIWQTLGEGLSEAIPMGHVQVKGREEGIQVYQVV